MRGALTPAIAGLAAAAAFLAGLVVATGTAGCAGTPWFLGQPLEGQPSIPPTSRAETVTDHRRRLDEARRRGEKVSELAALTALEQRGALDDSESKRLVDLLKERARDWMVLRRPLPLAEDLRRIVALDPGRARALAPALRNASRAAGDVWLALGENGRAEEEYRRAARLGATDMLFRFRAAWGASPEDLDAAMLERALAQLPERALAPFSAAYVAGGGAAPRLLRRAWLAARVYGPRELTARLEALPGAAEFVLPPPGDDGDEGDSDDPARSRRAPTGAAPGKPLIEPAPDERLYHGPTLARTLLPLSRLFPSLAAPGPRSREWSDRLLAEDPTAPDSLEFAALVDARANRPDGAARKLVDLVFYSADRAAGHARAAQVWELSGEGRRACRSWERAAQFGTVDDARWCTLLACLKAHPGAGDATAAARYVSARAPQLACEGEPRESVPAAPPGRPAAPAALAVPAVAPAAP